MSDESRQIATTMLEQIGPMNRMAVGARDFVSFGAKDGEGLGVDSRRGGGVMFRVGAGRPFQKIIIGYRPDDTYDVRYISAPTATASLNPPVDVRKHEIYAEDLGRTVYDLVNKPGRGRRRLTPAEERIADREMARSRGWGPKNRLTSEERAAKAMTREFAREYTPAPASVEAARRRGRERNRIPGVTTSSPNRSIPGVSNGLASRNTRARYRNR